MENSIKTGELIEEHQVECCPEKVSHGVMDENVDVHLIHHD